MSKIIGNFIENLYLRSKALIRGPGITNKRSLSLPSSDCSQKQALPTLSRGLFNSNLQGSGLLSLWHENRDVINRAQLSLPIMPSAAVFKMAIFSGSV